MLEERTQKGVTNEIIIRHFILGIFVLLEAILKVLNLLIPNSKKLKKIKSNKDKPDKLSYKEENKTISSFVDRKSEEELRRIIKSVDVFSGFSKKELSSLILSNEEALGLIRKEEREKVLKKMSNKEIKTLLKGIEGISRLKKSELIERVLNQEQINFPNQ